MSYQFNPSRAAESQTPRDLEGIDFSATERSREMTGLAKRSTIIQNSGCLCLVALRLSLARSCPSRSWRAALASAIASVLRPVRRGTEERTVSFPFKVPIQSYATGLSQPSRIGSLMCKDVGKGTFLLSSFPDIRVRICFLWRCWWRATASF